MQDTDFFSKILGIKPPWFIKKVELNREKKRVDIYIDHTKGLAFPCPKCEKLCSVYDHARERIFQHLNVCQMATFIHVCLPRVSCDEHGIIQMASGLGEDRGGMTYELETLVLDLAQECSVESVSRLLDLNWHTCWDVMERAVSRGRKRKPHKLPKRIGVDEKSFAKGHRYETLVYNIDQGTVEYVGDHREQESLEAYYRQFEREERAEVEAIAMDMWDAYIAATKALIPGAKNKIVFDRFHVMQLVMKAVDKVRKEEHRAYMQEGNELLKGSKYLWLWNEENIPEHRRADFEYLRSLDLKVCRARAMKDNLRHLWYYCTKTYMKKFFSRWYFWATHSRLVPMIKVAKTLKNHLYNILTYAKHRITNALGESLNSKIEKVKRLACGYRNREHYRTAIYFHCGGLDLYPKRESSAFQIMAA